MKIRYEVTVDDLVACAFYQSGRSQARRLPGGIVWVMFALFGLFVATAAVVGQEAALMIFLITALPILFVFGMLFKLGFRPNTRRGFRSLYVEALPRGAVGPHELELTEDCLVERTPYSERRTPLQNIQRVASDGERTFLCTGRATATVIPHRAVLEGNLEAFVEAVRMRVSENEAEPGAAPERGGS